jgi:putative phosphoesterase
MKYLIISDTHGYKNYLEQVLNKSHDIENIIYLGDGINDIFTAKVNRPNLNLIAAVAGNCDVNKTLPTQEILNLNGKKVLVCHGDGYHVKMGLLPLRKRSMALGADIALYGHTHRRYYEYYSGLYMFNPGSVMPSGNPFSCYGIMEIGPRGNVNFSFEEV